MTTASEMEQQYNINMSRTIKQPYYKKSKKNDKQCRNNKRCSRCRGDRLHKHNRAGLYVSVSSMLDEATEPTHDESELDEQLDS